MRGVFDEHEAEAVRQARDTELTLGSGTLLAIFFGLVLLCGLCFGMGYATGHHSAGPSSITPPQPAPDQEPLQASGAIPKPSAIAQTPISQPAESTAATNQPGAAPPASAAAPAAGATSPIASTQSGAAASQPEVHAALPAAGSPQSLANGVAPAVHPALSQPPSQQFMVQIASVSNPEDADVLANALKKRNYPVTEKREPADNLIHVRIGPFATHAIADQWRMKLLNDGYNAIIQP